ncbi:hypothetical protein AC249_AIPGENE5190 [Exaiptasia diaphana]|nr:hypothetical protein AC249_AIPGENE5190 [Exaiptasia diaphana]
MNMAQTQANIQTPSNDSPSFHCNINNLWLKARPTRLPREISSLLIAIIYRPDDTKDPKVLEQHIVDSADNYLAKHPDAGLIIMGDFNRMCTKSISRKLGIKQIVKFPTRGDATLDLILTNIQDYYKEPVQLPPLGRSDYNAILFKPKEFSVPKGIQKVMHKRKLNTTNLSRLYDQLKRENWIEVYHCHSVEEKTILFYDLVISALDQTAPVTPAPPNQYQR